MLPEAFLARTAADVGRPALAVLPVGAFEQHGGHLPLATDSLIAGALAAGLAEKSAGCCCRSCPSPARRNMRASPARSG